MMKFVILLYIVFCYTEAVQILVNVAKFAVNAIHRIEDFVTCLANLTQLFLLCIAIDLHLQVRNNLLQVLIAFVSRHEFVVEVFDDSVIIWQAFDGLMLVNKIVPEPLMYFF